MDELFGLSMTYIAAGAVTATLLIFATVAYLAWRNPVMFKYGLRNIPRRKPQTALIIVGLMLSTVIITAAFATGDTLTHSVTSEAYNDLGPIDETITWDTAKSAAPIAQRTIPLSDVANWRQALDGKAEMQAMVPVISASMPAFDLRTRLNEAAPLFVAAPEDDLRRVGGLLDLNGRPVHLAAGEVALNHSLADKLQAKTGDTIRVSYKGVLTNLTVKAIVADGLLSGTQRSSAREGAALQFDYMAELVHQPGAVNFVAISNDGSTHDGVSLTDDVTAAVKPLLAGTPYKLETTKQDAVSRAQLIGSVFTSLFITIGLFSIAAGVLLIFLIFVMLAAERKPEMGMARALGAKRRQIVESFLAEGMGYDLGSAIVGLVLGVGVAAIMTLFVRAAAGDRLGGLTLEFSVAARSLIVAFSLGLLTTFMVVFFASWRASRINIVAAIRDLPDPHHANPEAGGGRGYARAALNGFVVFGGLLVAAFATIHLGAVGLPLLLAALPAVAGPWVVMLRNQNFGAARSERKEGEAVPKWPFILGAATLVIGLGAVILIGYSIAILIVRLTREHRPRRLPAWLMLAGAAVLPLGLVLVAVQRRGTQVTWSVSAGLNGLVLGGVMVQWGLEAERAWLFATGVSLVFLWGAVTLRYFHLQERLSFSLTSVVLLVFWYLVAGGRLNWLTGRLAGGPEMIFVSGVTMVTAGTFLIVYNADAVLPVIARFGSRFGRIVPAVKTAVAYPLTARGRTGLTIGMIALIMFVVSMQASFNTNFAKAFNNADSLGGYDVRVKVNPNNLSSGLVDDLKRANPQLDPGQQVPLDRVQAAGEVRTVDAPEVSIRDPQNAKPDWKHFTLLGVDDAFAASTKLPLQYRAAGYADDSAVWQALEGSSNYAVIPEDVVNGQRGGFVGGNAIDGPLKLPSTMTKASFAPFTLSLRGTDGQIREVTVIGQLKNSALTFWPGIIVPKALALAAYPGSTGQTYFLRLNGGTDARIFANQLEVADGAVTADSTAQIIDDNQTLNRVFLDVFQGFLALGLIVGVAALGVISSRAVVERRQQIGMLRAIGYQRSMVQLSFILESGFVATSGISLGLILGISLAWNLFSGDALGDQASSIAFTVPWLQIGAVTAFALLASAVMTLLPARAASRVPVADALRYE